MIDEREAAAELLARRQARADLRRFAQYIDIPGVPADEEDSPLWVMDPPEARIAAHHDLIMREVQTTMQTPFGRLIIMAPPGSAKSTYVSVVGPAWYMGANPGHRLIGISHGQGIIRKQSRRVRTIARSVKYRALWRTSLAEGHGAVDSWALTNGAEYMASGIQGEITGNRANGLLLDDLIAGREEAESETIREKVWDAFRDDALTRLIPGAWVVLIMTRWHEDDPVGRILPAGWNGESGVFKGTDGMQWKVLCIPAQAKDKNDVLGRKPGEYLWPEWFPEQHWLQFKTDPRSWQSLFQQVPAPEEGGQFERKDFRWYDRDELPKDLKIYGASDFAVTDKGGDFTEHGVVGMDSDGNLWFIDWLSGQTEVDDGVEMALDLIDKHKPLIWWDEGGVIDKSIRPLFKRRMRERQTFVALDSLPSISDKKAKVASFRGRAKAGTVFLPRGEDWATALVDQAVVFPYAAHDDKVDVLGLIGRGIAKMMEADKDEPPEPEIKPFTPEWLEWEPEEQKRGTRYR